MVIKLFNDVRRLCSTNSDKVRIWKDKIVEHLKILSRRTVKTLKEISPPTHPAKKPFVRIVNKSVKMQVSPTGHLLFCFTFILKIK